MKESIIDSNNPTSLTSRNGGVPHTLDELEVLWHAQDNAPLVDIDAINGYIVALGAHLEADPSDVKRRLVKLCTTLLDSIANDAIWDNCSELKGVRLFQFMGTKQLGQISSYSTDMKYAIATLLMRRAIMHQGNDTLLIQVNTKALNSYINAFVINATEAPIVFKATFEPRLSQQVARLVFPAPWCVLVEPTMASFKDLVGAIWVARPPLLDACTVKNDNAYGDICLPDIEPGPP